LSLWEVEFVEIFEFWLCGVREMMMIGRRRKARVKRRSINIFSNLTGGYEEKALDE
jgi:hypothetical protein